MDLPHNPFKEAILAGRQQIGLWCMLPGSFVTEALAGAGYDWLLLDTEHSPADVLDVLPQLQAAAAYDVSAIVRPAANDPVLIKRFLDIGAQSLLIPYVQSVEEAEAAVAAVRYPPAGIRGVAGSTRAARFGKIKDYTKLAADELCLIVQVETRTALDEIEAIAAVDGVDGIFVGPFDLALTRGRSTYAFSGTDRADISHLAAAARAAGKPWWMPAWRPEEQRFALDHGASVRIVAAEHQLLQAGLAKVLSDLPDDR